MAVGQLNVGIMAKVIDHIKNSKSPLFSLEILPPSTGESIQKLFDNISPLMEFKPKFVNVTYHREEYVYKERENGLLEKISAAKISVKRFGRNLARKFSTV